VTPTFRIVNWRGSLNGRTSPAFWMPGDIEERIGMVLDDGLFEADSRGYNNFVEQKREIFSFRRSFP